MNQLLKWLDGKKQKIGNAYWLIWIPTLLGAPTYGIHISHWVMFGSGLFGYLLSAWGAGHQLSKMYSSKEEAAALKRAGDTKVISTEKT